MSFVTRSAAGRTSPHAADNAASRRTRHWRPTAPRAWSPPHADPKLKSARRYTNRSAAERRPALIARGDTEEGFPAERTLREIRKRRNDRLKRIQKGKPLKKTDGTEAIVAHVKEVREQVRNDAETRVFAMEPKAKVALGDDVRGGKNQDGRPR